jgi:Amt family ammonium transporter
LSASNLSTVTALDGFSVAAGGIEGNGIQIGYQFAEITAISAYSFTVSCALLYILKYIPGMHLRVTEEAEILGLDLDQFFDEQIGDWTMFEDREQRTFTVPHSGAVVESAGESGSETPVAKDVIETKA